MHASCTLLITTLAFISLVTGTRWGIQKEKNEANSIIIIYYAHAIIIMIDHSPSAKRSLPDNGSSLSTLQKGSF